VETTSEHQSDDGRGRVRTLAEAQALMRSLPPVDADRWSHDREADDERFGSDRLDD
jgi:hypothetical protein